ncbi:MAG: hypothetical protein N4J56_007766 [Chroococcidiopsis sp. SAG 2025]|nr:hypothetical protein [Chroococcidiopsis sp. SAG 2025]
MYGSQEVNTAIATGGSPQDGWDFALQLHFEFLLAVPIMKNHY